MTGSMKKITALLAGTAAPVAAWGLGYAAGHKEHGAMIALDEVEWIPRPTSPVEVAVLSGDPATGAHVRPVKLPAGFVVPDHAHTGDYHGVNLTGTWKHTFLETGESHELPPGSFVFQPGGEMHGDACIGSEDCIIMLSQSVAADFILPSNDE